MATTNFCSYCGTQVAHEEDTFCRGCGARLAPELPAAPVGRAPTYPARPPAPPPRTGRDGGNVAWGIFWGLLWLPSVFFMLRMKPGPKREDRFFGYWLGIALAIGVGVVIGIVSAAGSSSSTAATASAVPPTSVVATSLLTNSQVDTIIERYILPNGPSGSLGWGLVPAVPATGRYQHYCANAKYGPADRKWVSTCTFTEATSRATTTRIFFVDDTTGKVSIQ